jgi:hypothetical protein
VRTTTRPRSRTRDRSRRGDDLRNYFAPIAGGVGQTASRQLDGLAAVGQALSASLGKAVADLWQMRNGYAMCDRAGLEAISEHLAKLGSEKIDALRGKLAIGVQSDVEVTEAPGGLISLHPPLSRMATDGEDIDSLCHTIHEGCGRPTSI